MSLTANRLLEEETLGNVTRARLNITSLTESDIELVRSRLFDLVENRKESDLCVDLGCLEYLTSSGLGLFLALHKRVRATGGRLRLHNVSDFLYELFTVTHLTTILHVSQQGPEEEALVATSA
ncbi:MAG TPA: STAS domain-containing protein [Gemmataceae bacterium]|nr:STAS domain-containing protein [Gemmataceae bacterium]